MKWKLYQFDAVVSTNDIARDYPVASVISAKSQTGGRGRMGRTWVSPMGNLYLSLVVPTCGVQTPLLSFLTAVAVVEALPAFDLKIKWPNDVLLSGSKVCGILLENMGDKVIIGIGINVAACPTHGVMYPTASLNGLVSLDDLTTCLLDRFSTLFDTFLTQSFTPIYDKWMLYATGLGKKMTVRLPHVSVDGIFTGIDTNGMLHLTCADGTHKTIAAGDVFIEGKKDEE